MLGSRNIRRHLHCAANSREEFLIVNGNFSTMPDFLVDQWLEVKK